MTCAELPRACALAAPMLLLSLLAVPPAARAQPVVIPPVGETAPVPSNGDAADDLCMWIHPIDPALSLLIGTDKDAGLAVYDLAGTLRQFVPGGELNNVDIRYGFPLGILEVALVTSGERSTDVLAIYVVEPTTRTLSNVAAGTIPLGFDVYGCCMYRSPTTGEYYFFGTSETGEVRQWRLFEAAGGGVTAQLVRAFNVGSQVEGCVADDENAWLFLGEEDVGIWRYGAEPNDTSPPVLVDTTGPGGELMADVEGLAIYYASGGGGYLLASSQGNNTFVVYQRAAPHDYLFTFQVGGNLALGIDAVTGTDGIDVTNRGLGGAFPGGLFVTQDDANPGSNQNFKLVPWQAIAAAASPPLVVDAAYDPHDTGCSASWSYRNGIGVNPPILVNLQSPILGSVWQTTLNCAGNAPGGAFLAGFTLPSSGTFLPAGEVLVDFSSELVFLLSAPQSGNVVQFSLPLAPELLLCGFQMSVQGACFGSPIPEFSNAIDIVLGG